MMVNNKHLNALREFRGKREDVTVTLIRGDGGGGPHGRRPNPKGLGYFSTMLLLLPLLHVP